MEKTKTTKSDSKKTLAPKGLSLKLFAATGEEAGTVQVPAGIFDVTGSDKLIAQYVRVYLANQRQGTHKTKKRGEVKASTKKIYKQKGTGRARHGALSAPIFVGGGVAHGVMPQSHSLKLNKKQRQKALYTTLTLKRKDDSVIVIQETTTKKTKDMNTMLTKVGVDAKIKALVVYGSAEKDADFALGLRNLQNVRSADCRLLNAYEVLNAKKVLFTEQGLQDFVQFRGFTQ